MGQPGDTLPAGACPVYVSTDSGILEHHDRAVLVDWGIGGRTGHYPRQLAMFPQTGDRRLPGGDLPEPGPDSLAGSGNFSYLCICGRGSAQGVDTPAANALISNAVHSVFRLPVKSVEPFKN